VDDSEPRQLIQSFIQGEVIGFQVTLDSLHSRSTRAFWWSPPVLQWGKLLRSSRHLFCLALCNVAEQWATPCLDDS